MTALDDLPDVSSFFGVDLRTGSMIIAALGIVSNYCISFCFFLSETECLFYDIYCR